ncbi:hypothetical protein Acsp03_46700 [Actinomadura sp. NBRC 104412]|uniref:glycosyltransferase n=1 Tax=Actinomadura sp. NBRC 104412 TaxID=3032203 RepID=UPI0024A40AA2|nr:glycosyltransferase [Actinomadura sp. NBRC 104412]GLZ07204.1 hypothetical protein Acsp03_46700 [Actinomadura sp. NBRC 104412]
MTIVHIVDRVKAGHGRGLSALALARAQRRVGWDVRVLVSGVHGFGPLEDSPWYEPLFGAPRADVYRQVGAIGLVAAALAAKTRRGDTLVCHEGVDLAAACALPGRRVVAAVHSDPDACLAYLPASTLFQVVRRADHWVAWGTAVAAKLHVSLGIAKDRITIGGQAMEPTAPASVPLEGSPACLSAARVHPVKNHAVMLGACALLARRWPDIRWHMVGGCADRGYLARLRGIAEGLGVTGRIVWHGHRDDVAGMMLGSDVTVLASHSEGIPRAIQESMALGVPTVMPAELCADLTHAGLPVAYRPNTPHALARAVEDALTVDADRLAAASAWVGRRWAWEEVLSDWVGVLARLGEEDPRAVL